MGCSRRVFNQAARAGVPATGFSIGHALLLVVADCFVSLEFRPNIIRLEITLLTTPGSRKRQREKFDLVFLVTRFAKCPPNPRELVQLPATVL